MNLTELKGSKSGWEILKETGCLAIKNRRTGLITICVASVRKRKDQPKVRSFIEVELPAFDFGNLKILLSTDSSRTLARLLEEAANYIDTPNVSAKHPFQKKPFWSWGTFFSLTAPPFNGEAVVSFGNVDTNIKSALSYVVTIDAVRTTEAVMVGVAIRDCVPEGAVFMAFTLNSAEARKWAQLLTEATQFNEQHAT